MGHDLRYLVNCSLMFTEVPLLRRPASAREAGFDAIEFWWPFQTARPSAREVDAFVASISDAGVELVGLNVFAGDLAGNDCGLTSIPGRGSEFRDSVGVAADIGARLGVSVFNALYGVRVEGSTEQEQDELAAENLAYATKAVAAIGATVLIEPVSGPKPYPLRTAAEAVAVVREVRASGDANIGFLLDLYHLAANGADLDGDIAKNADAVAHVQVADHPGRGEPGTGKLDHDRYLTALQQRGYSGRVGLEYAPSSNDTTASLAWRPRSRRGAMR